MAVITVCDIDGKAPAKTVYIQVDDSRYAKDLCDAHIKEMVAGAAEVPKRGRPRKPAAAPKRGRPRKAAARQGRKTAARRVRKKRA